MGLFEYSSAEDAAAAKCLDPTQVEFVLERPTQINAISGAVEEYKVVDVISLPSVGSWQNLLFRVGDASYRVRRIK